MELQTPMCGPNPLISCSLREYPCHVSQHPLICPEFSFYLPARLWKEFCCITIESALVKKCFNLSAAFCRTSNWASRKSQPLRCRQPVAKRDQQVTHLKLCRHQILRFSVSSQETLVKSLFDILQLHDFGGSYSAAKQSHLHRSNSLSMHVTPLKQDGHIGKIGTSN